MTDPTSPPSPDRPDPTRYEREWDPSTQPPVDQPGAETAEPDDGVADGTWASSESLARYRESLTGHLPDPLEGLAEGAAYEADRIVAAVTEPGYAEHPPPWVNPMRFPLRGLVDQVADAWKGTAPGDLTARIVAVSTDEVAVAVEPSREADLFAWAETMKATGGHPDWTFDLAAAGSTVSGWPTVFVKAKALAKFDPRPLESRLPWHRLAEMLRAQRAFVYRRPRSGQAELRNSTAEWFVEITADEAAALEMVLEGPDTRAMTSAWADRINDLMRPEISLAAAVQQLQDAIAPLTDEDKLVTWGGSPSEEGGALLEAARAVAAVFHRQPVEGWHWIDPATGAALDAEAASVAERLVAAERLAQDVRRETGGSPTWAAVVAELLDHLAGPRGSAVAAEPEAAPEVDRDLHWSDPAAVHGIDPEAGGTLCGGHEDPEQVTTTRRVAELTCGDCRGRVPFDA